ncbi:triose-phosphate isomerase [Lawsonibacter sp. DFI.6.74]|nr:triose-phosphate isomerase [Lawsonibacter sp. DFI.6.74]
MGPQSEPSEAGLIGRGGARERAQLSRQAEAELSGLCDDEDGGLIGGASLKPADFVEIINSANQE